ncbi:3-hydroxybutyrate dehydrogenase [Rhizobium bangladeshense]|uniref:3-hydroxybutyrate dehydrogenase n=1 Tax=Rhizobium bangladeshense TaxID=1138189 RepID=A0ABS7LNU3_9HYPH|nr:3-hydroxybutyrate dehydrogenase [Rhizobium bangladeshense]MBX4870100.1 3-hydroxybutyrate dehydrogenase [Rhizobium bangladeshense]MBX4904701.1 3-hydroxybutyrate dehydrogenase [Rhizobium bangladeshense]MBX4916866.1 3-hydroxybutyrate dehydrogenase [Rhizobium bangladeshense]MBX4923008.1 3-hydroxybutyrate dehydrogenase [Rhizobium bangladeshense]MBX4935595.1 3-hydroxybutyrate dehydrogenase [Rhizobium bangladeshense]
MLNAFDPITDTLVGRRPLEGRSAIVTGSTSGIGLGIAHALARAGAAVMLNGFGDPAEIEMLREGIATDNDVDVAYDAADMSKPEAIRMMVERAVARFGQVDIVVNNAGIQHVSPLGKFPPEKWDAILAINLSSAFHLVQATFDSMCANRYGRIVNVASAHGLVASPFKSAYVAAKHGIVGFSKTIALEGAEYGVTSNAICPGYVWTPLVEHQIEDQAKSHKIPRDAVIRDVFLKDQPTRRFATVEEMGALAVFLCSDLAGSITGTAIPVDGGWTAH